MEGKQFLDSKSSLVKLEAIVLDSIAADPNLQGNTSLGMSLIQELEHFSDLQHCNGFVRHTFSLKAEGMFANQGGSAYAGMAVPKPEKISESGSLSSRKVAQFGPE